MIRIPQMALLGAAGRKSGKTELASALLRRFGKQRPLVAVKVTPVDDIREETPPVEGGILLSHRPDQGFYIWQEQSPDGIKDTSRLLRAGASRVFWMVVMADRTREALQELLHIIGPDTPLVCESNSLRLVAEPGIFLLVRNATPDRTKRSVALVRKHVDRVVVSDGKRFDLDLDDISLQEGRWTLKLPVSALVMADGTWKSNRTALGDRGGCRKDLVEAAVDRLRPWFKQLSIACSRDHSCPLVGIPVITVADAPPVLPRTIESALRAAAHDTLLVTGCDPDRIEIDSIRKTLREIDGRDAVLSPSPRAPTTPAFAVFHTDLLPALQEMIASGDSDFY